MNNVKQEITWDVVIDEDKPAVIELTNGKFVGTTYRYGACKFGQKTGGGRLPVAFEFKFENNPHEVSENNSEFVGLIGEVLMELISDDLSRREKLRKALSEKINQPKENHDRGHN